MAVDKIGGATRMQSVHDTDRSGYRMTGGDAQSSIAARKGMSTDQLRAQNRGGKRTPEPGLPQSVPRTERTEELDDGPPANVDRDPRWLSPRRLREHAGQDLDTAI